MDINARAAALADRYTLDELKVKHNEAVERMESGTIITSASSSGGTSYNRTVFADPGELVELYRRAIAIKEGRSVSECSIVKVRTI